MNNQLEDVVVAQAAAARAVHSKVTQLHAAVAATAKLTGVNMSTLLGKLDDIGNDALDIAVELQAALRLYSQ